MSTKTTNLTNKAGEQSARSLSMRALTPGGSALKRSQIFRAHFRPSKMHFIAGIPGSTQRLASCGLNTTQSPRPDGSLREPPYEMEQSTRTLRTAEPTEKWRSSWREVVEVTPQVETYEGCQLSQSRFWRWSERLRFRALVRSRSPYRAGRQ